jgi:hypothetical protein
LRGGVAEISKEFAACGSVTSGFGVLAAFLAEFI